MTNSNILETLPFFAGLSSETLAGLAEVATITSLADGEALFDEGDARDDMYFVISGSLQIVKGLAGGEPATVATLKPGAILGEGAIFETGTRTASALAGGPTDILVLPAEPLQTWLMTHPEVGVIVLGRLGSTLLERLSATSGLLREARAWATDISGAARHGLEHLVTDGRQVSIEVTTGAEINGRITRVDKGPAGVELQLRTAAGYAIVPYAHIVQLRTTKGA